MGNHWTQGVLGGQVERALDRVVPVVLKRRVVHDCAKKWNFQQRQGSACGSMCRIQPQDERDSRRD